MSIYWLQSSMGVAFILISLICAQIVVSDRDHREFDGLLEESSSSSEELDTRPSLKPSKAA